MPLNEGQVAQLHRRIGTGPWGWGRGRGLCVCGGVGGYPASYTYGLVCLYPIWILFRPHPSEVTCIESATIPRYSFVDDICIFSLVELLKKVASGAHFNAVATI